MSQTGTIALDVLKEAVAAARDKFEAMTLRKRLEAIERMTEECGLQFNRTDRVGEILLAIAGQGSIDAVGMLIVIGANGKTLSEALRALTERSADLKDGLLVDGLTTMVEERCEEEVRAGRMTKQKCPKTGRWLYSTVEK